MEYFWTHITNTTSSLWTNSKDSTHWGESKSKSVETEQTFTLPPAGVTDTPSHILVIKYYSANISLKGKNMQSFSDIDLLFQNIIQ